MVIGKALLAIFFFLRKFKHIVLHLAPVVPFLALL